MYWQLNIGKKWTEVDLVAVVINVKKTIICVIQAAREYHLCVIINFVQRNAIGLQSLLYVLNPCIKRFLWFYRALLPPLLLLLKPKKCTVTRSMFNAASQTTVSACLGWCCCCRCRHCCITRGGHRRQHQCERVVVVVQHKFEGNKATCTPPTLK